MKQRLSSAFILLTALFTSMINCYACTIFMAHDKKSVWIGNNEDETPSLTYRLWYYPALNTDNGYMIWTELSDDEYTNRMMYKNPQGGMNEWGLFLDYTAISDMPAVQDPKKKNREEEVVTDILKKCRTVSQALKYVSQFNLIRLTGAQLFIGDASGDYATVHGGYIITRKTQNFALTNYCIKDGYHEACWRRDIANQELDKDKSYRLSDIVDILQKTAQKKTSNMISNYSMAANLGTKTIHLFYKTDFTTPAVISLEKELKKGKHQRDMVTYFPLSLTDIILKKYAAGGINSVVHTYQYLRKNFPKKYNFRNSGPLDLAIQAVANGNIKDGIRFMECLKSYDPKGIAINSWLGVAYRRDNRITESDQCFAIALTLDPDNYVATLFGKQKEHMVTFQMNDFQGAEEVSLIADFSKWKPIPLKKQNGTWVCHSLIPPGEYNYKFIVNKEYLADQINLLYTGSGSKIYSKLYVW